MKKAGGARATIPRVRKEEPRERWRTWTLTLVTLAFAALVISLVTQKNEALTRAMQETREDLFAVQEYAKDVEEKCNVSSLCLQESEEGGVYGVAKITAHYVGEEMRQDADGSPVVCRLMQVDSANDLRIPEEIDITSTPESAFAISEEQAERFADTTSDAPASLLVYVAEREGRDTGLCPDRVHILN